MIDTLKPYEEYIGECGLKIMVGSKKMVFKVTDRCLNLNG